MQRQCALENGLPVPSLITNHKFDSSTRKTEDHSNKKEQEERRQEEEEELIFEGEDLEAALQAEIQGLEIDDDDESNDNTDIEQGDSKKDVLLE